MSLLPTIPSTSTSTRLPAYATWPARPRYKTQSLPSKSCRVSGMWENVMKAAVQRQDPARAGSQGRDAWGEFSRQRWPETNLWGNKLQVIFLLSNGPFSSPCFYFSFENQPTNLLLTPRNPQPLPLFCSFTTKLLQRVVYTFFNASHFLNPKDHLIRLLSSTGNKLSLPSFPLGFQDTSLLVYLLPDTLLLLKTPLLLPSLLPDILMWEDTRAQSLVLFSSTFSSSSSV